MFSSCENSVESDSEDDEEKEKAASSESKKDAAFEDKTFPHVAFAVDKAILREVEEMEEKVFTASLQVKVNRQYILTAHKVTSAQYEQLTACTLYCDQIFLKAMLLNSSNPEIKI